MTDREERQSVIEVLEHMLEWMKAANTVLSKPERIKALDYAINSIKTDLKYDLLYEETTHIADADKKIESTPKNDLGVDCISRAAARSLICDIDLKHHTFGMSRKVFKDLYNGMDELPPVTPQEPKGHGRLIDADEVIKNANKTKDLHGAIWNAPTIIEANKAGGEK